MKDQLLLMTTRLRIPQPRKSYIVREELFNKLDTMWDYRVVLIKGSAGTGKTTLMSSFAKERDIVDIKWISLDEDCNNVFLFWSYLIEVVGTYMGSDKQDFIALYKANFQKSNIEQLLIPLINALDHPEDIFITLDDFHHIRDDFLIQTIEFFLRNASDNVHLILLTREEPALYLAALNMEGRLLVIDENDLKLSQEAGVRFLSDTLNLKLDDDTLAFMNAIAEGWIGGLQLVATAVTMKREKGIKRLNLESSLIEDYLTKEIYEIFSNEEKKFLVSTSILPYFNEEICVSLLEGIEFRKIIEDLLRKNVLITCIDEEKGIYRYHNILREYLKRIFKDFNKEKQKKLHLKAADIFKALGEYQQCMEQLLLAEDFFNAMKLVIESPKNMTLFSYADKIPEAFILKNPDFAYQSFFYHYINMESERCNVLCEALKDNIKEDPVYLPFKFLNILAKDNFKLNEMNTVSTSKVDELPLKETTKALLFIKDASFLYNQCRYDEALSCVEKAMSYSISNSNPYIVFFSSSIKSQILEDKGELYKCEVLYNEMQKILSTNKYIIMFNISFYIGNTGVQLKKMDLNSAKNGLSSAKEYIVDRVSHTTIGYKYNLAEYNFLTGDTEEGMILVKELMNIPAFHNLIYMSSLLQYVFRLNNFSGELVEQFMKNFEDLDERDRSLDSKLLYANILFYKGQPQPAIELIDQILKYCRMREIKFLLVQASLAKINMIFNKVSKKRDIVNLFREALYYSCENKILLPFYLEKDVVDKLIKQFGTELYSHLNFKEKEHYQEITNICKIEIKSILSERELDVLQEIAKGASNKEIAERLCISVATVKSHIINIYSKLQVNNRVAAVEEAKKLGII